MKRSVKLCSQKNKTGMNLLAVENRGVTTAN